MGWIAVDFDGTLAASTGPGLGPPIAKMIERVKRWLAEGKDVRVFTARVADKLFYPSGHELHEEARHWEAEIILWCVRYIGRELVVTCVKDYGTLEIWDDRAIGVVSFTGMRADGKE